MAPARDPNRLDIRPVTALAGLSLVALGVLMAALAVACIGLISAARAYVAGESEWSKAQKTALLSLLVFADTGSADDWARYEQAIVVPLGDRRAREAMSQPRLDTELARQGLLQGRNHPDDVEGMIRLFRWFHRVPYMARAIDIWAEADDRIAELADLAARLRAASAAGDVATMRRQRQALLALEERFTPLEQHFSATLGEASRWMQQLLATVMTVGALLLVGLAMAVLKLGASQASRQAQALQDSEARRLRQLRGSSDGFWEWDLKRSQAYYSPRFAELLGLTPEVLRQEPTATKTLLHPDDHALARDALRRHLRLGEPYDVTLRLRHADGRWRWLRSRAQTDRGADGSELRLSGSISDVTAEREARELLRRREVLFRSLWETTSDAVLIVGTDHGIRFANPSAHTLFGFESGSLVGQPLAVLQPPAARAAHAAATARYLRSGQRRLDWRGTEIVARHRDGHPIPVEICFSDFELDGERMFVGFLRDITKRREAQEALQGAHDRLEQRVAERTRELTEANQRLREVDRLKSEFLATMSHELRTPLNAVIGFTSLLLEDTREPLTANQRVSVGHVARSGRHLLSLINDVLDLSRIESGRMDLALEDMDVVALVREVMSTLGPAAAAKGIELSAELPPTLPWRGDRRKLLQILLNLGTNAVKFTPKGGVCLRAWHDGEQLHAEVEDTGVGIAAEQLTDLFQPFHQLDGSLGRGHEGTGLGLYLSQRLAGLMDGRIEAFSEPGRGSRFRLSLAASAPAARPATLTA